MGEYYRKKSGQIPAFGNWECANEMPITQYFECARQAGLIRYTSSSGECDPRINATLYNPDPRKSSQKARTVREKRYAHVKETRKDGRKCDSTEHPKKNRHISHEHKQSDVVSYPRPQPQQRHKKPHKPKAVDEDLYKIPPELLRTTKKKKMLGFFSWCVCAV